MLHHVLFPCSTVANTYTKTQDVLSTYPQPKADESGADQTELHLSSNKKENGEEGKKKRKGVGWRVGEDGRKKKETQPPIVEFGFRARHAKFPDQYLMSPPH